MSWIKLSLIIPMYNVESYISECINSIQNQITDEVEVIIIDDGSTDNSKKILDELIFNLPKNKAKQFKVFSQKNQGQSAARNLALSKCSGDYIAFLDSDDIIAPKYFDILLSIIDTYHPDIIRFNYSTFKDNIDYDKHSNSFEGSETLVKVDDGILLNIFNEMSWFSFINIYKKKFFKNNKFPIGVYFEDIDLISRIFLEAETIYFLNDCLYYYRINMQSSIRNMSDKNIEKLIFSYENILDVCRERVKQNKLYSPVIASLSLTYLSWLLNVGKYKNAKYQHKKFLYDRSYLDILTINNIQARNYYKFGLAYVILKAIKKVSNNVF